MRIKAQILEEAEESARTSRRYLHVEDLVRALRLARDVADFVGGLGGQRGRGVAVDGGVAEWPERRETPAEASGSRLNFGATYRGQTHREKASPTARRRSKKDKEKMSDYKIMEPAGITYKGQGEGPNGGRRAWSANTSRHTPAPHGDVLSSGPTGIIKTVR